MSEALRKAAMEIFGPYNNGNGAVRPPFAHDALGDVDRVEYGEAMDGISSAIQQAYRASEGEDGNLAFRNVKETARTAVDVAKFTDVQIARVALSEISVAWIVSTSPTAEQVKTMSDLVMKSRSVAKEFLKLYWWDDALDID